MSLYALRRLVFAALREGLCFYAATAGERLAKKHIKLPPMKKRTTRSTKRKKRRA